MAGEAEEEVRAKALMGGSPRWMKRSENLMRRATASLQNAESMWCELMSLLGEQDPSAIGGQRLAQALRDQSEGKSVESTRPLRGWSHLLQLDEKKLKTVAELYNPQRFQATARQAGMFPGEAFDLTLGHDVLQHQVRSYIQNYFKVLKPGLTIISAPCTMFSMLQNLNQHRWRDKSDYQNYARRLGQARLLLRFATQIVETILSYGGTYVFEHPLTSKAWLEREVQNIIQREDTLMVRSDQCRFGLKSVSGGLHMKPTGWLTNSEEIRRSLDKQCSHEHVHEHVIGSSTGGSRARLSQEYPPQLVQAIIHGYRKQLANQDLQLHFFDVEKVKKDLDTDLNYLNAAVLEAETAEKEKKAYPQHSAWETYHNEDDEPEDKPRDAEAYRYLPRERPFSLPTLIRRAHEGLGHCGNDRLARILKNARASPQAIQMVKDYHCPLCEQQKKVQPARAAAPPRELHTNSIVGVDSIFLPGWDGRQKLALNVVCWATRFQMIIPLQNHTPAEARRGYLQWCRFMGPPEKVYSDLGREFRGAFELGAELDSTYIEPGSLEMPTQRSITERAGKSFKEIFHKTLAQHSCTQRDEWLELVDVTTMVCNRLLNKSGYSPLQRVLGYNPRIPGSQFQGGSNDLATQSRYRAGDLQVQRSFRMRLAASKAFHEADCEQALRNALYAGTRIPQEFEPGQLVYFWRKATDRPKKNQPKYWRGPARVILVSMPTSVWISFKGIVVKAAPEQLRHASTEEQLTLTGWIDDIAETRKDLEKKITHGYIDLTQEEIPDAEEQPQPYDFIDEPELKPTRRLVKKTKVEDINRTPTSDEQRHWDNIRDKEDTGEDYWLHRPSVPAMRRVHVRPREHLWHPEEAADTCPFSLSDMTGERYTLMTRLSDGLIAETTDDFREPIASELDEMEGEPWTGYTDFLLHERHCGGPELYTGGDRQPAEQIKEESTPATVSEERIDETMDKEQEKESEEPTVVDDEDRDDLNRFDSKRLATDDPDDSQPAKRHRSHFLEVFHQSVEKILEAKRNKEINFRNLSGEYRETFKQAMLKEINNNIETGAYECMTLEESEKVRREMPDKILQSRYVLVEKPIEESDVAKAKADKILLQDNGDLSTKAKARHVMKGFSEWDAEGLDASTPQVSKESITFLLQIISSLQWVPGYLDFTQAFHSGDQIQRVLFAEPPPEGIPNMKQRQLLRLKKCCYGLLDGPYQWYVHLRRLLVEELGYEISRADPCVFYLFGVNRRLEGIIGVATDDLLHGGTKEHWNRMHRIQAKYKLGKFSHGEGRFAGKEVKYADGVIKLCQPIYTTEKIKQIPLTKERKGEKMSYCNTDEITQLRGLLGSLSWLAKETRPDLSGRVALLQQCMPRPFIQDLLDANALTREAVAEPELGINFYPIPPENLRVGTVTDASWGNARQGNLEQGSHDFWEEKADCWIRHHLQPRTMLFHPGGAEGGPDLLDINPSRTTFSGDEKLEDSWNEHAALRTWGDDLWLDIPSSPSLNEATRR